MSKVGKTICFTAQTIPNVKLFHKKEVLFRANLNIDHFIQTAYLLLGIYFENATSYLDPFLEMLISDFWNISEHETLATNSVAQNEWNWMEAKEY